LTLILVVSYIPTPTRLIFSVCKMASESTCQHSSEEDSLACEMKNFAIEKRRGRGAVTSGLTHECGVFGAIGCGEWPTTLEISQIICWGLVALQHRLVESKLNGEKEYT
jgi:hypothetical protein